MANTNFFSLWLKIVVITVLTKVLRQGALMIKDKVAGTGPALLGDQSFNCNMLGCNRVLADNRVNVAPLPVCPMIPGNAKFKPGPLSRYRSILPVCLLDSVEGKFSRGSLSRYRPSLSKNSFLWPKEEQKTPIASILSKTTAKPTENATEKSTIDKHPERKTINTILAGLLCHYYIEYYNRSNGNYITATGQLRNSRVDNMYRIFSFWFVRGAFIIAINFVTMYEVSWLGFGYQSDFLFKVRNFMYNFLDVYCGVFLALVYDYVKRDENEDVGGENAEAIGEMNYYAGDETSNKKYAHAG